MDRVYRLIVDRPQILLAVLALLTAFFAYFARGVRVDSSVETILPSDDPGQAYYKEVRRLFGSDEVGVVGIVSDDVYLPGTLAKIRRLTEKIGAVEGVARVVSLTNAVDPIEDVLDPPPLVAEIPRSPEAAKALRDKVADRPIFLKNLVSPDGRAAAINVFFADMTDDEFLARGIDDKIEALLAAEHGPEEIHYTGLPHFKVYSIRAMWRDLAFFVPLTLVVVVVVLFLSFRSFRGVWIPALTVIVSLVWTLGIMVLAGSSLTFGSLPLPPLLLVIGTAYSLHVIAEYHDLAVAGRSGREVVLETLRSLGAALFITAVTTVLGFVALACHPIPSVREMGIYASVGIVIAYLLSLFLVPALLAVMPVSSAPQKASFSPRVGRLLRAAGRIDVRHRRPIIAGGLALAAISTAFLFSIRVDSNYHSFFRPDDPIRLATDAINDNLVGTMAFYVVVDGREAGVMKKLDVLRRVKDLQGFVDSLPGVDKTVSLIDYLELLDRGSQRAGGDILVSPDGQIIETPAAAEATTMWENITQFGAVMTLVNSSPRSFSSVLSPDFSRTAIIVRTRLTSSREISDTADRIEAHGAEHLPPELEAHATGNLILLTRTTGDIVTGQIQSFGFASLVLFVILSAMFLSTRIGFLALLPSLLPIAVFFGLMGLSGAALNLATSVIASIALGLAVDNTIHIMTRLSAEVRATDDPEEALLRSLASVGKPALFASLLCFLGFIVLAFSRFVPIQEFGWLSAATILVGLGSDVFFLPALLATTRIITIWDLLYLKLGRDPHKTIPLFATLRPAQAKIVALMGELKRFPGGEPIVRRGDTGDEMFVILGGRAEVRVPFDGKDRPIRQLSRGDVFGEMGLVRQHQRTADVVALEDVEVMAMNDRFLTRVQRRYPRIAAKIFLNISKILSDRLEQATQPRP